MQKQNRVAKKDSEIKISDERDLRQSETRQNRTKREPNETEGKIRALSQSWRMNKSELEDGIYSSVPFHLFRQAGLARIDHTKVSGLHFHLIPGQKFDHGDKALSNQASIRFPPYCLATTWLQEQFWNAVKNRQGEQNISHFWLDRNNVSTAYAFAFEPRVFRTIENSGFSCRVRLLRDDGYEDRTPQRLPQLML